MSRTLEEGYKRDKGCLSGLSHDAEQGYGQGFKGPVVDGLLDGEDVKGAGEIPSYLFRGEAVGPAFHLLPVAEAFEEEVAAGPDKLAYDLEVLAP